MKTELSYKAAASVSLLITALAWKKLPVAARAIGLIATGALGAVGVAYSRTDSVPSRPAMTRDEAFNRVMDTIGTDRLDRLPMRLNVPRADGIKLVSPTTRGRDTAGRWFVHIQNVGTVHEAFSDAPLWVATHTQALGAMILIDRHGKVNEAAIARLGELIDGTADAYAPKATDCGERALWSVANAVTGSTMRKWHRLPRGDDGSITTHFALRQNSELKGSLLLQPGPDGWSCVVGSHSQKATTSDGSPAAGLYTVRQLVRDKLHDLHTCPIAD